MNSPPKHATLGDLAGMDQLVGRRVRFLEDDIPSFVPKGTIGVVTWVTSEPRVVVDFERTDMNEKSCGRHVHLETRFVALELVES